ncbi:MAG TPA: GAF domain-containing protein [Roseiflexaceae bacterium]|nr:GAF domain-containing protein [Roseiflexaceae bacterium]
MNTSLARWLTDNRDALLPRWMAFLRDHTHATNGNGAASNGVADLDHQIVHPDEQGVLLASIYDGLISAANRNYEPLNECLRLLRALRTHPGEDELPRQLSLAFNLRRAAWGLLLEDGQQPRAKRDSREWSRLVDELDRLLEYTSVTMAEQWIAAAAVVQRELNETKLLVESLYHDAEATDRTTLQVSNLNQIAQGLSASMDRAQQLEIVGEKLKEALAIASLTIWLSDSNSSDLVLARSWGDSPTPDDPTRVDADDPDDLIARAFRQGESVLKSEVDPALQGAWYLAGCTVLATPLVAQRHVIGVIVVQDPSAHLLQDRSQQDFIKSAASQAAIALENARLYDEVRGFNSVLEQRIAERTRELQLERDTLETLHEIALETTSTLDRDSLLESSLSALAKLVGAEYGSIMLVEPETEHLIDCAVLGRKDTVGYRRFSMGQGIVGWVAQHKKPAVVPDISKDPRWVELPGEEEQRKTGGSMIAVPLIAHHQTMGVLLLSHDDVGYFNEDHLRLLSASAGQIAIGINNAQLYAELEKELLHRSEMFQRQESEATQSQAILQSLSDGVIVCGDDGSVLTANLAVERILERSIEELVIWNLPELLRRLLGRRAEEVPVEELLARPTDERHAPRTFATTFEMGTRMISVTLGPVLNSKEALLGVVAVFRDITREVESDRLKTEFIGTVSHELRTPMTSIKGFTQLLAMGSLGPVNDTQKEFLQIIQTNAERMITIINDLLDITKIETGSVELDLRPLHLAESLSTVMMELQANIRAREHELSISIPPGLPLVRADAKRLNQILVNLLSNAVKYTPRRGKIALYAREIGVDAVPEPLREGLKPAARYALIEVCDTGVGVAPEELERIFDRFYRTENPLKVEAGGTGLGLSLVRPLIQLFGGRIWVNSTLNEGSTFSFVIPAA